MKKNNKKFFVWIMLSFLQTLSGAENKNFSIVPVLPNDEIALRFVACHYLNDHHAICCFAETNKTYHGYMVNLPDTRKKPLFAVVDSELLGTLRHKYGSIHYQAYRRKYISDLILTKSILKNGEICPSSDYISRFVAPLPYKKAPFFNTPGDLSFYGYGIVSICSSVEIFQEERKDVLTILQYQTSATTHPRRLQCLMAKRGDEIGGKQMYRRFDFCMEYPFLLKAILNSSQVTQGSDDQELVFWLDGVTIPDNYGEKIPMPELSKNWEQNSYEHLPDIIKSFIEKT